MPKSTHIFKDQTIDFIKQKIETGAHILDIGAGMGTYSDLLKEEYPNIDAIEAYEPYVTDYNLRAKYKNVMVGDVNVLEIDVSKYNLFILGDVLEHMNESTAVELIKKLTKFGAEVIVAVPFNSPQGDVFDNKYERHLQPRLTLSRVLKTYPELTPMCVRFDYGVFITKQKSNQYVPIFYKELDDASVEKLKTAYPYKAIINVDTTIEEIDVVKLFGEAERSKEVTIVTGLWDLGRGEISDSFKRSYDQYKQKFAELLKAPVNMIIYVSEADEDFIWQHRTKENTFVKTLEQEEFKTWFEFYDKVQEIRQKPEWTSQAGWLADSPQATLPMYNPMVMSKMFMLNNASIYNPFNSSYFYWIDAGIANTVHPGYFTHDKVFNKLSEYNEAIEGFLFLSYPYEGSDEIHGFPRAEMARQCGTDYVRYVCRGGFFGGLKTDITAINSLYYGILASTITNGFMGTEENIFTILAHKFPEMVNRFELKGDGLIWPFFEKLKNVEQLIQSAPTKPVTYATAKNILYVLTYNSPQQFESVCKSIQAADDVMFTKSRKILINNSTDETTFQKYDELCAYYGFEEIHRENLGVCGGRQFAAEHFATTDANFYMFFEDDMHLVDESKISTFCRNGFRRYVPNLYEKVLKIMVKEKFDFLKFSFSEFYGDNSVQWAWYNVPQSIRTENWPNYDKLPEIGLDPNAPKTDFETIHFIDEIPYIKGEIYYSNWPQIVSRDGNKKMFLDTTWARPYEQTWMSHMYQLTKKKELTAGLLLASPVEHERFEFYEASQRKES